MQNERYVRESYGVDPLRAEIGNVRWLALLSITGIVLMLVGLRMLPEEATPLSLKVMGLLTGSITAGAFGAYAGRNLQGWGAAIGLLIASIVGMFIVMMMAGTALGPPLLLGWGFLVGMSLGPLVSTAMEAEGYGVIMQAFTGTSAIMVLTGLYVTLTGADFRFIGKYYFIGVLGLLLVGLVGCFIGFSRKVNLLYSLAGIGIFSIGLLYKFSMLARSENTWEAATRSAISLYLSFVNIFAYLLQFLLLHRRR